MIAALYGTVLFTTVMGLVLSIFAPSLGVDGTSMILTVMFMVILAGGIAVEMFLWNRYINKVNPVPEEGFTAKSRLEWWNNWADIYSKYIWRILLISMGILLLLMVIFGALAFFLT